MKRKWGRSLFKYEDKWDRIAEDRYFETEGTGLRKEDVSVFRGGRC
jgi:hypothetical protein